MRTLHNPMWLGDSHRSRTAHRGIHAGAMTNQLHLMSAIARCFSETSTSSRRSSVARACQQSSDGCEVTTTAVEGA